MNLGIIDYGRGNLRSVANACLALGHEARVVSDPEEIDGLSHVIFPGQGAFGECMGALRKRGLEDPLKDWLRADRPYFGICMGYQLLFENSEEAPGVAGLGVVAGRVRKFSAFHKKVPHMGWNEAVPDDPGQAIWDGLGENPYFYFIHSYFPEPEDDSLAATRTVYEEAFVSAIRRGRLLATQFHPEKSQHAGLALLGNFLREPA